MRPSVRFLTWLDEKLGDISPGDRLPTDRQFAATFGLSPTTVRRILKRLRDQNRVTRIPGKGTFVPGASDGPSPSPPKTSAENIAAHVLDSILSGRLRRGQPLPPPKQVVHAFGVSRATVRRAYDILVRQRHVARVGRRHWVGDFRDTLKASLRRDVYLFVHDPADFEAVFRQDPLAQAYQKMERELIANGYFVLFAPAADLPRLARRWRRERYLPHGFVFFSTDSERFDAVRGELRRLRALSTQLGRPRPRILLDWRLSTVPHTPQGTLVLSRGNLLTVVARELAQYLYRRRCGAALFFGNPGAILSLAKVRAEIKHLDEGFEFRFVVPRARTGGGAVREVLRQVRQVIDRSPVFDSVIGKYGHVPAEAVLEETAVVEDHKDAYARFPRARVWVVQTDREAADVLAWAQRERIRVPKALCLVSHENSPDFYHLGLTCCYPDYEQIGHQMAHVIINDVPVARTSRGFIRANALLVEKLTT